MTINSIIFDWKRTLYDPDTSTLIDGAIELLNYFSRLNIPLYLIGKGQQKMHDETVRLDVAKYFQDIIFVEGSKDPNDFFKYMKMNERDKTLIIGDRIKSELKVGNTLGATTIWIKQGKFANEKPETVDEIPNYTVNNLLEIINLKF
jgi:phosphoglycolate phosphatase-like HAD superfamily hydrolase